MAKMYYENDADMSLLEGRTIGVIGYGSQGHAHALNLKDSGVDVMVGLYEGSGSWPKAEADGLKVGTVAETAEGSEIVMVLIPDHLQGGVYKREIEPHMGPDKTLMFAHGFNIHYETIVPPDSIDVSMVAPKAPGHRMREVFTRGSGVPGLLAIHQDASGKAHEIGLAYARGVGCTRAGVLDTTFKEETETDLFGEQSVLCGGVTALIKAAFETLIEAGYQPESAYFECMHELKLIVDLLYQGGMEYMRYSVRRYRRVRGLLARTGRHRPARQGQHEEGAGGGPGRELRPRVDRRERRGPPPVHAAPQGERRASDRGGRQGPQGDDVVLAGRRLVPVQSEYDGYIG